MLSVAVKEKVDLSSLDSSASYGTTNDVISIERLEDDIFTSYSEAQKDLSAINDMIKNLCNLIDLASVDNKVVLTKVRTEALVASL